MGRQTILYGTSWLVIHWLVISPLSACRPDRLLHCWADYSGGRPLHGNGVRLVQPDQGRAAFHAVAGRLERRDHGCGICPYRRATARTVGNYCPVGHARFVGCPLYRHSGDYRANPAQKHSRQRWRTSFRCNAQNATAAVPDCAFGDTCSAIRVSRRADHRTAHDHCDAGRPDPHPGLFQLWPRLSVEPNFRRATLRRRSLSFDWRIQLLRAGSSSRNQPFRLLIWRGARNSGWRSC